MLLTKFGTIPSQGGELWLNGWSYGKKITIPEAKVDAELTNFPLTVYLNNTNFDFSKAKADGSDIRFTDKNMSALIFERKEHTYVAGGISYATYNVKIPTISATTNTEIYMWYGNASATNTANSTGDVWDDNYVMVQHMGDSLVDATGNGNNGTATGTTVVNTDYGKARSFNGTSDYMYGNTIFSLNSTMMVSTRPNAIVSAQYIYSQMISDGNTYNRALSVSSSLYSYYARDSIVIGATALGLSQVVIAGATSSNGNSSFVYSDGIKIVTSALPALSTSSNGLFNIGRVGTLGYYYGGIINAVRISNIARSDAWIKAESLSLKDNLLVIENVAEKLADIEVTVATTSINITGLNLGKGDEVMLVSDWYNPLGTACSTWLRVNENNTNTNYYGQYLNSENTTVSAGRDNLPSIGYLNASLKQLSFCKIKLTNSGYFVFQCTQNRNYGLSSTFMGNNYATSTFTMTAITSLSIVSGPSNGIGIGSRFQLYRIGRGI